MAYLYRRSNGCEAMTVEQKICFHCDLPVLSHEDARGTYPQKGPQYTGHTGLGTCVRRLRDELRAAKHSGKIAGTVAGNLFRELGAKITAPPKSAHLDRWLHHDDKCQSENNSQHVGALPCDCGLDAALAAAPQAQAPSETAVSVSCSHCDRGIDLPVDHLSRIDMNLLKGWTCNTARGWHCPECSPPTKLSSHE